MWQTFLTDTVKIKLIKWRHRFFCIVKLVLNAIFHKIQGLFNQDFFFKSAVFVFLFEEKT